WPRASVYTFPAFHTQRLRRAVPGRFRGPFRRFATESRPRAD
ncbi:MAG: hypothetical protein AVDCRST_MAG89-4687, partial [uncultured Gemmatimonadetes bacterium]